MAPSPNWRKKEGKKRAVSLFVWTATAENQLFPFNYNLEKEMLRSGLGSLLSLRRQGSWCGANGAAQTAERSAGGFTKQCYHLLHAPSQRIRDFDPTANALCPTRVALCGWSRKLSDRKS